MPRISSKPDSRQDAAATPCASKVILVLGGARSGKSRYAQKLAERTCHAPLYLATAEVGDNEMAERVRRHKAQRGTRWSCVEESLDVADVIRSAKPRCDAILMDCVTIWLTNVMLKEGQHAVPRRTRELIRALRQSRRRIILVANEVGMGIVPATPLGREFRDEAGWLNQALAATANTVVLIVAGLPWALKGELECVD